MAHQACSVLCGIEVSLEAVAPDLQGFHQQRSLGERSKSRKKKNLPSFQQQLADLGLEVSDEELSCVQLRSVRCNGESFEVVHHEKLLRLP